MEWLAGAAAVLPLLALVILLLMAIRRQHRAIREVPPSFGEGPAGEDDVREPRRPLVPQGSASAAEHPFRLAFETRDLDAWVTHLADDVVAYSPMFRTPFKGRELLRDLYDTLLDAFESFEITHEFRDGASAAFFWRGQMRGRTIDGVDLLRQDERGEIYEITVFIRPLVALADFGAGAGPPFARRIGRVRAVVARLVAGPLRTLLVVTDAVGTRIVLAGKRK